MTAHFRAGALTDRPLTLGVLTPHNALDRRTFSGTAFHAAKALGAAKGVEATLLGGHHRIPRRTDRFLRRRATRVTLNPDALAGLDMVIGLVASPLLERMTEISDIPFLHITDATPAFLHEVYGWNVPNKADQTERHVAARAARVIYSSAFMANRAHQELGLSHHQTAVVPFGINLDVSPDLPFAGRPTNRLNLLFVGADWQRKGGEIAVAALDRLRASGVNATLTLVGHAPEAVRRHPHVIAKGFLDKNIPREQAELALLYAKSHVLLLPTRADCTPMVIPEAMVHGTPVLATDTGGCAELIGRGHAGQALSPDATANDWAEAIRNLTMTPDHWAFAADAAADRARQRFGWEIWAREITAIAARTLAEMRLKAA